MIYTITEYIQNKNDLTSSIERLYNTDLSILFLIIICLTVIINWVPLVALVNLMLFHVWLYKKGVTTFEYIMQKREKAEELQDRIKEIEEQIRREEEKISQAWGSLHSLSINSTEQNLKVQNRLWDQKTKGSINENNENYKWNSMPLQDFKKTVEDWKDDILDGHEDYDSKWEDEQEVGFRVTSSSVFKQVNNSRCHTPNSSEKHKVVTPIKNAQLKHHPKMNVIDDVSESREMSQQAFESFKADKIMKSSSYTNFSKTNTIK